MRPVLLQILRMASLRSLQALKLSGASAGADQTCTPDLEALIPCCCAQQSGCPDAQDGAQLYQSPFSKSADAQPPWSSSPMGSQALYRNVRHVSAHIGLYTIRPAVADPSTSMAAPATSGPSALYLS